MDKAKYQFIRYNYKFAIKQRFLLLHFAVDALLIVGLILTYRLNFLLCIPIVVVLMFRSFSMMHEASHGLASKNKHLNFLVGLWAGACSLLPFEPWRRVHLKHHHWSGNIKNDPVMALVNDFPNYTVFKKNLLNALWKMWVPVIAYLQHIVFWKTSFREFKSGEYSLKMLLSVASPLFLWIGLLTYLPIEITMGVVAPSIFLYLLSAEVVNLPHHLELESIGQDKRYPLWEQHYAARSCEYPFWMEKIFILNFNYHLEHHMYPDAPWYYLKALSNELKPLLKDQYNFDPGFSWVRKSRLLAFDEILARSATRPQKKSA